VKNGERSSNPQKRVETLSILEVSASVPYMTFYRTQLAYCTIRNTRINHKSSTADVEESCGRFGIEACHLDRLENNDK
jgi:hypothetical protein